MKLKKLAAGILAAVIAVTSAITVPVTAGAEAELVDITAAMTSTGLSPAALEAYQSLTVTYSPALAASCSHSANHTTETYCPWAQAAFIGNVTSTQEDFTVDGQPSTTTNWYQPSSTASCASWQDAASCTATIAVSTILDSFANCTNWKDRYTLDSVFAGGWDCTVTKVEATPVDENGPTEPYTYAYDGAPITMTVQAANWIESGLAAQCNMNLTPDGFSMGMKYSELKALYTGLEVENWEIKNVPAGLDAADFEVSTVVQHGEDWSGWTATNGTSVNFLSISVDDDSPVQALIFQINYNIPVGTSYKAGDTFVINAAAPETEEPVTEEPVTEEPVTEEPATEEPVTEEPATEEPVAPTVDNLTATAGENSVTVQWDEVEGATNYKVFTYLNGKYAVAGETTDPYYYVGDLEAGTEYGFLVRALVNGVWTSFTNDDVVYATPKAPVVTKASVTAEPTANAGEVALTWNEVTDATNYKVFTYLNGKYAVVDETTETSYTVTGLKGGTEYGFLVRALVNGAWTAFDTAEDVAYATPVAAASTKPVIMVTVGAGSALVEWEAVAGATNYRVYTYRNGYVLAGETTETSFNVTGLTGGVEYGFLVRALVDGKWSAFTTEDNVYITPSALKPAFEATAGVNSAEVEWDAIDGATSYKVFTYRLNKYTLVATTEETSYTVTGLVGGTEYGVLVRACVNGVWTAFTTADNIAVTPLVSAKPANVNMSINGEVYTVSWDAVEGATSYRVFNYIGGKYYVVGDTTETSFTSDDLCESVLVRACVNGVWSPFTVEDVLAP